MMRRAFVVLLAAFVAACGISVLGVGSSGEEHRDASFVDPADGAVPPGDDAEAFVDAGTDSAIDASVPIPRDDAGCPTGRGPAMLHLFGSLCVDETEVSSKQYKPFVADFDAGRAPAQSPDCASNVSVTPLDPSTLMTPSLDTDDPVDRIDHCDARLYCEWAGKHICGRRDGTSAVITAADANNATIGEWYAACSQNGATTSVPASANLAQNSIPGRDADGQVTVGADPPGGPTYAGRILRHIVGNVAEWADGCDGSGNCIARGASVKTPSSPTDCTTRTTPLRMDRRADLGFRCCAKPVP
jgi:sulfatase modifying factor 1